MKIQPMPEENGGCDFNLVELADDGNIGRLTPHCKIHRAMNKVSQFREGGGFWRCISSYRLEKNKEHPEQLPRLIANVCRAGCVEYLSALPSQAQEG